MQEDNSENLAEPIGIKELGKRIILLPYHIIRLIVNNVLLFILGSIENGVIIVRAKKSIKIEEGIKKLIQENECILRKSIYLKKNDSIDEIKPEEEEEQEVKRINVLNRIMAIVVISIVWSFQIVLRVIVWIFILINCLTIRKKVGLKEWEENNLGYYRETIKYLTGISEEIPFWKELGGWGEGLLFILVFDLVVIRNGFLRLCRIILGDTYSYYLIISLVYIIIFVILIPKYLKFPSKSGERKTKQIVRRIGVKKPKSIARTLLIVILLLAIKLGIIYGISLLIDYNVENFIFPVNTGYIIAVSMSAGIAEEIIYRGYVIEVTKRKYGTLVTMIISGCLFGLAHFALNPSIYSFVQMLFVTFIGITYAYFRILSDSLIGPIVMHTIYDIIVLSVVYTTEKIPDYVVYLIAITLSIIITIISINLLKLIYKDKELLIFKKRGKEQKEG